MSQVELGAPPLAHSAAAHSGVRWCGPIGARPGPLRAVHSGRTPCPLVRRRFPASADAARSWARGISAGGAPGRTRTCDLEIRRLLLYPAELRGPGSTTVADLQHRQLSRRHPLDRSTPSNRFRSRWPDSPAATLPARPRAGDLGLQRRGGVWGCSPGVHPVPGAFPGRLLVHDIPLERVGSPRGWVRWSGGSGWGVHRGSSGVRREGLRPGVMEGLVVRNSGARSEGRGHRWGPGGMAPWARSTRGRWRAHGGGAARGRPRGPVIGWAARWGPRDDRSGAPVEGSMGWLAPGPGRAPERTGGGSAARSDPAARGEVDGAASAAGGRMDPGAERTAVR